MLNKSLDPSAFAEVWGPTFISRKDVRLGAAKPSLKWVERSARTALMHCMLSALKLA